MNQLDIDIRLERSEFVLEAQLSIPRSGVTVLLGPSGSGKSSLLRTIAGLEKPSRGRIDAWNGQTWFDSEKSIFRLPRFRRTGMVFQEYALFPHLSVSQNIGYGVHKSLRSQVVPQWLERFHLQGQADYLPGQLSGGQKQRTALARALAHEPEILLLDEPFSAIDSALRRELRRELKQAISGLGCPVVMVTHDLEDARYLADYVAIVVDGGIEQYGPVNQVFDVPKTTAAATVLGWRNILPIKEISENRVIGSWGEVSLIKEPSPDIDCIGIRPEHIRISSSPESGFRAIVTDVVNLGSVREIYFRLENGTTMVMHHPWNDPAPTEGTRIRIDFPPPYICGLVESNSPLIRKMWNYPEAEVATT